MVEERKGQGCPECGSAKIMRDYDSSEIVCEACGYVLAQKIASTGPERGAFDEEQRRKRTRTGAPLTYTIHDKGLTTIIDWHDRGKTPEERLRNYNLRKWQVRTRVSGATERNLATAFVELDNLSSSLNIPKNVQETASVIYRIALNKKLVRGRSTYGMAAASLYVACRQCGVIRTLEEISEKSRAKEKDIARMYRLLGRELDTVYRQIIEQSWKNPMSSGLGSYISRHCNKLYLSGETEKMALRVLDEARKMKLTIGKSPAGQSAGVIYVATTLTGERKTQREIAQVASVSEVTVRNRYKPLVESLFYEVPL